MKKFIEYLTLLGLLALFVLHVAACETKEEAVQHNKKALADRVEMFGYFKDPRTNLCFAGYGMGWNYGLLANVPCSPEVEKLIKE